jgi:hypothetical protein
MDIGTLVLSGQAKRWLRLRYWTTAAMRFDKFAGFCAGK